MNNILIGLLGAMALASIWCFYRMSSQGFSAAQLHRDKDRISLFLSRHKVSVVLVPAGEAGLNFSILPHALVGVGAGEFRRALLSAMGDEDDTGYFKLLNLCQLAESAEPKRRRAL